MSDFLVNALNDIAARLLEDARKMEPIFVHPLMGDFSYTAYTEYGRPPEPSNCIESTAIVINDNVKTLPEPVEQKESEKPE